MVSAELEAGGGLENVVGFCFVFLFVFLVTGKQSMVLLLHGLVLLLWWLLVLEASKVCWVPAECFP